MAETTSMDNLPEPQIRVSKTAYTVWLLPFVALLLAMFLIYKNYTNAGIIINITFPDANGIIAGKTAVKFRGIEVGRVRNLTPLEDGSGVLAQIEMNQDTEAYLTDKLKFWLVKPHVGIGGISGLETLLSGAYIQVDGGEEVLDGNSTRFFEALVGEPPVDIPARMLVYKLVTNNAAGINKGALIYHRNIPVGKVYDVKLSDDHQSVEIVAALEPKFKGLVKRSSRFWNISGIKASFGLSGVDIESNGLAAMAIGGVAFSSPDKSAPADEGTLFRLYASADSARDSLEVKLNFAADADVKVGTAIYFNQQKVGEIESLQWLEEFKGLTAKAKMSLDMTRLMRDDTEFWLDAPAISMDDINMGHLIQGTVIRVSPGAGELSREFSVANVSPYKRWAKNGLHLTLTSLDAYGLRKGSGIYYKSQQIGSVQWVDFNPDNQLFSMDVLIYPKFKSMVHSGSQFYNMSGVEFDANVRGVSLSVPSIGQMISGGVGLHLNNSRDKEDTNTRETPLLANKSTLALFESLTAAIAARHLKVVDVILTSRSLYSPAIDTPLYYKSFKIGKVAKVTLLPNGDATEIGLSVEQKYRELIKTDSRFWLQKSISVKANIRQVELSVPPLMSMIEGGVVVSLVSDNSTPSAPKGSRFTLFDSKDNSEQDDRFVNLIVTQPSSLAVGAEVNHRGFKVGEVTKVELLDDLSGSQVKVKLQAKYASHFMREDTLYYLLQPQVNLTGVKNLTAAVLGDSIAVQKGSGAKQNHFTVNQRNVSELAGLRIQIHADELGSLDDGDPLLYKQLRIGEVIGVGLTADIQKVSVDVVVYPQYAHLITPNSQFFNASGIKVDAGLFSGVKIDTQTLETIIAGGIKLVIDEEQINQSEQVTDGQVFSLSTQLTS